MPAKVFSCATIGLKCELVEVEVDILGALNPALHIVGLGDTAIQESKERIRSAFKNSNLEFPRKRKIVNLAPADLRKYGPLYDLPIAVGILLASKQIKNIPNLDALLSESLFIGELSLDGGLKAVNGIINIVSFAQDKKFKRVFLPKINAKEASLISDIEIIPLTSLQELVAHIVGEKNIVSFKSKGIVLSSCEDIDDLDFKYIKGQQQAKRALEISITGGHNILLTGPPGSGKTLLARSICSILPDLTQKEAIEITKIYSNAGLLRPDIPLINKRPFRSVHHSASGSSIVGGGKIPKPGEISLAHKGVLFLDEIAEFPLHVLEYLRQPLEDRVITIGRAFATVAFPAHFTLVASMNPCPCGYFSDPDKECICTPHQISRYQKKISGPLLDRIDLYLEVPRVKYDELSALNDSEDSGIIKSRINKARQIQRSRFQNLSISSNSELGLKEIKKYCPLPLDAQKLLKEAICKLSLSARAYFRIIKVARTIADLEGSPDISCSHIAEALQYRKTEPNYS